MIKAPLLFLVAIGLASMSGPAGAQPRPAQWRADLAAIASDANEGRMTGSAGYLRAADYVEHRFRELGLKAAGDHGGFRRQVRLEEQRLDDRASRAELVGPGGGALGVGEDLIVYGDDGPLPVQVDAPLVFLGYGLHLPRFGYDDFAGVDVKGKVVVVIAGGPKDIPGPVKAANKAERGRLLARAGALGIISVTPPAQVEIPWARQALLSSQAGIYLAEPDLRDVPDGFFWAALGPAWTQRLFEGSGHSFAEVAAASDAGARVATFPLLQRFKARLVTEHRPILSPNLAARLDGADRRLRKEYVVVSAHLDHVGVGPAIDGDAIYNGALDDAGGVATVLDIASVLSRGPRPRRSVLFLVATAEEPGLLGSTAFVRSPPVPRSAIVADVNFDVLLPLWPLTTILALGDGESTLGGQARAAAGRQGLEVIADPLPNRNGFIRTDQFSFVRSGIPALALKFGFPQGSDAFRIEHDWRANRYHAPSDEADQPGLMPDQAIRFDDYAAEVTRSIADDPARPAWLPDSIFRPGDEREAEEPVPQGSGSEAGWWTR